MLSDIRLSSEYTTLAKSAVEFGRRKWLGEHIARILAAYSVCIS